LIKDNNNQTEPIMNFTDDFKNQVEQADDYQLQVMKEDLQSKRRYLRKTKGYYSKEVKVVKRKINYISRELRDRK